ncbi:MAG: hypothetical protein ACC652_15975, partial [Acidimicrobiales bacterium]
MPSILGDGARMPLAIAEQLADAGISLARQPTTGNCVAELIRLATALTDGTDLAFHGNGVLQGLNVGNPEHMPLYDQDLEDTIESGALLLQDCDTVCIGIADPHEPPTWGGVLCARINPDGQDQQVLRMLTRQAATAIALVVQSDRHRAPEYRPGRLGGAGQGLSGGAR